MILLGMELSRPFTEAEQAQLRSFLPRRWADARMEDAILAAHALLRLALREAGQPAAELCYGDPGQKPWLSGANGLYASLSHTDGAALCALAVEPVGVDVQRLRPVDPLRLRRALGVAAGEATDLLWLWARRESAAKRSGAGLIGLKDPLPPGVFVYPLHGFAACSAAVATAEPRRPQCRPVAQAALLNLLRAEKST